LGSLGASLIIAGCVASPPQGPSVLTFPGMEKSAVAFQQDQSICQRHAISHSGYGLSSEPATQTQDGGAAANTAEAAPAGPGAGTNQASAPAVAEKHGTKARRAWRKLHLGVDADTGQIVASALTSKEVDDGVQVGPLLDQLTGSLSSFTADGAYDQDGVYAAVADRHPEAEVIVPPRITAVPSSEAETAPTQRDRHLIDHGVTGFLVNSIDDAVAAIGRIGEIDRAACRAAVTACFSVDRMADRYLQLYRSLLA
jgi:hypothetical protein